jgi:release factor glutamine methyltransferase
VIDPLYARLAGKVDLLCFNPPYVATDSKEWVINETPADIRFHDTQAARGIGGAWAGGPAGMDVTDRVIDMVHTLLAPNGRFYLVAVIENDPTRIVNTLQGTGLQAQVCRVTSPKANYRSYSNAELEENIYI